jgi:hypothetical protein
MELAAALAAECACHRDQLNLLKCLGEQADFPRYSQHPTASDFGASKMSVTFVYHHIEGSSAMPELDDRTFANIEVVLNDTFRDCPNGGDHERRRHVAQRLVESAKCGNTTLGGLSVVAKTALNQVRN